MPTFEFSFDLELPGQTASTALLEDLATRVLGFVGRSQDATLIIGELQRACGASRAAGNGHCSLSFVSREGRLEIAVTGTRGRVWHTTRPLP